MLWRKKRDGGYQKEQSIIIGGELQALIFGRIL